MAKMLADFAMSGQGVGARAKKGSVAMGGRPNVDDQRNAVDFKSGTSMPTKAAATPRLDQAPAKTSASRAGVSGSVLPLGQVRGTPIATPMRLKNAGRGARGVLPLGRAEATSPISRSLKNAK